jgi:phage terminase small subunit
VGSHKGFICSNLIDSDRSEPPARFCTSFASDIMHRGTKPRPTRLKILAGVHPCRINRDEPKLPPGVNVEAPGWLKEPEMALALEHWNVLAPMLLDAGVLSAADLGALGMLCLCYQRWRDDADDWKAQDRYLKLCCEFGLTPSSRSRIRVPQKPADALTEFLRKRSPVE